MDRFTIWYQHSIFPPKLIICRRSAVSIEDLKLDTMNVEGMIDTRKVNDFPYFHIARMNHFIDILVIHFLTVDGTTPWIKYESSRSHGRSSREPFDGVEQLWKSRSDFRSWLGSQFKDFEYLVFI